MKEDRPRHASDEDPLEAGHPAATHHDQATAKPDCSVDDLLRSMALDERPSSRVPRCTESHRRASRRALELAPLELPPLIQGLERADRQTSYVPRRFVAGRAGDADDLDRPILEYSVRDEVGHRGVGGR
jgi:hypothetical protein